MQRGYRGSNPGIFQQHHTTIGQKWLSVEQERSIVIVKIILVLAVQHNFPVLVHCFQQGCKIITYGYPQAGNIAATQPKIRKHIFAQRQQIFTAFLATQHRQATAIAPDDVRLVSKISLKITRGVIAAGGHDSIYIVEAIGHRHQGLCPCINGNQLSDEQRKQPGILFRALNNRLMSGNKSAQKIMKAHQGNVTCHDNTHALGFNLISHRIAGAPTFQKWLLQKVIADCLYRQSLVFDGKPGVVHRRSGHHCLPVVIFLLQLLSQCAESCYSFLPVHTYFLL